MVWYKLLADLAISFNYSGDKNSPSDTLSLSIETSVSNSHFGFNILPNLSLSFLNGIKQEISDYTGDFI